jgi:hypothetical protein
MAPYKTSKEINEQKRKRMLLIIDNLRERPMPLAEIEQLVCKSQTDRIVRRSVQNYLAELIALRLVNYNFQARLYEWTENKREFRNKHDYDIALKHSRYLTLSTSEKQRLDQTDPYLALDLLAYIDEQWNQDVDDQCLVQHLRTGYFEVYSLLQSYRQAMDKMGFSERGSLPKLSGSSSNHFNGTPAEMIARAAVLKNDNMRDSHAEGEVSENEYLFSLNLKEKGLSQRPLYSPAERKKMKELYDLRDLLVGKIYSIANDVRNGIPLQGYCDYCPSRRITFRSKP